MVNSNEYSGWFETTNICKATFLLTFTKTVFMLTSLFKKKKEHEVKRDPTKSDFCYYPFFQVLVSADGKYMPCSHHNGYISQGEGDMNVKDFSIEQAWNSEYMNTLRSNFLNNTRHKGCSHCWKEQSLGLKPMRFDSYGYGIQENQVQAPISPKRVEINASNVCNLRCRICGPHASTRWLREAKELYGQTGELHFNMTPENQAVIRSWVPHFEQIGFFGGEPFMSQENLDLMRFCVDSGNASHISLLINTNATIYTEEIVRLLKQFKYVYLNFSIDDIGERFEYQRSGAKWEEVLANLLKYWENGSVEGTEQLQLKICCSVTAMNIYYFPEYFHFINKTFPKLPVFWNLVFSPAELSMQIFPKAVKEIIANRLREEVTATYAFEELKTRTVENLISYMNGEIELPFDAFFKHIERHDKYRHESFEATFPAFWEVIKAYKENSANRIAS